MRRDETRRDETRRDETRRDESVEPGFHSFILTYSINFKLSYFGYLKYRYLDLNIEFFYKFPRLHFIETSDISEYDYIEISVNSEIYIKIKAL
ncbi:hypothetical protein HGM15179_015183 [Zosterops borbonicus]|uniref:Uncharacterized protein n=1 Tax=Zosterops borbonicus TaxID=364589 RepID=A0A8K1G4W4_9PASS|nr:hypothetical protein HGM15179_015183 [Zosterops borbonicus]